MKKKNRLENWLLMFVEFCSFFKTELIVIGTLIGLVSIISTLVNM